MNEPENPGAGSGLTASQEYMRHLWEEHVRHEFATHNTETPSPLWSRTPT